MPPRTNQESAGLDHKNVRESILKELPSLDSVAAEGINTHEIPTFNEFHAMVSERSQSRKGQDCEVVENVGVANPDYDINIEQKIKASQIPQGSEKVLQTHIDVNPSVKSSRNQIIQDVPEKSVFTHHSSFSDNIKKDSASEQHQSLQTNSVVTSNSETNSKSSSHVTSQPVITTTTSATTTITNNDAVHTPGKIDLTLRRNVASVACGAKMLGFSRAIKNPEAVLNENNDEYMNVPCSEEKWLVLEVCQPVQLRTIELANYELFSSRLKSFRVYANDRYPAKSWELIGTFTARDVKGIQSFSVVSGKMIKYVKDKNQHLESHENDIITKDNAKNERKDDQTSLNTTSSNDGMYDTTGITEDNNHHIVNISTYDPEIKLTNSDLTSEDYPNNQNDDHDHKHIVDKLSNIDSTNSDSSVDSSTMYHTDDTASSDHHHKLLGDRIKKYSERTTTGDSLKNHNDNYKNKFCEKIDPVKALHKPFCPAGSILYRSINHINDHSTTTNCHTSKVTNSDSPTPHKSHFYPTVNIHAKVPAIMKLPPPIDKIEQNNKSLQNMNTVNLTSKLHNKLFNQVFNPMNLFTRLANAIKHTILGIFLQFFPSTEDTNNPYLILNDIVPTLENYHTINYLFNPIGLYNSLCNHSMIYLTMNQIKGLWYLRKCLRLLDVQYSSYSLKSLNVIHPMKIEECSRAIHQLNLTMISHSNDLQDKQSYYYHWPLYELDKSIGHLFIAYQMMQHNQTLLRSSSSSSYCIECEKSFSYSSLYDHEKLFIDNYHHSADIVIQNRNSKSSNSLTSSTSSTSSSMKSLKINRPHSHHDEALVVPAALGGSHRSTAYMRLNNRVRIIERNVSVSMRYLEELSQSYRRQMERLSRSFNLTYAWLKVTAHSAEERDRQQQHRISQLELQLNDLTARIKSRLLNSLPASSSSSGQPDLTLTSSPLSSTTPSSSSSESIATTTNTEGTISSSSNSKSSNLVTSLTSPPPLPDFESSLDWNPWLKSQHDDWYMIVDGDMVVTNNNEDVDDTEFESDDSYQTNDDVYLSRLDGTTGTLSKNYKEKFKQTTTGTTNSKSSDNNIVIPDSSSVSNNPNEYNAKSLFDPYLSTRNYKHQHYHMESSSSSSSSSLFSEWKQFILDLLWLEFSWPVWIYNFGVFIHNFCQMNTMILNIFSLVLLHLILASIVHFLIYWIWLRPKNLMLSKFDTELLLSSLYQVLYCRKNHPNFNSCIVYFNSMNSTTPTHHLAHLLPSININTTTTTNSNYDNDNPHTTDNVTEHHDDEYDRKRSFDKASNLILTNTMITATNDDDNNNLHTTDNLTEHHDDEYDKKSFGKVSNIILTNTMITTTTTNGNNSSNNNNTNNITVPKVLTCYQMNELSHIYKPTIEMTYDHLIIKTDLIDNDCSIKEIHGNPIVTNVNDQCMNNNNNDDDDVHSCCLIKEIQVNKIEDNGISSSQGKFDPQLKHVPSLLQLPTIYSSSDNSQFNKDELKCGENDCSQSSICQLNEFLPQECNKPSCRPSLNQNNNDLEPHLSTSTHLVMNSNLTPPTLIKKISKSMNNNHKRKHKRKRELDNNGFM
ncbi:hypothetical protein Smp_092950 [Schistosoma mansoni]|uniref:hypothetical protein n=1 Tax=Schistosoma mansoni TaxID=6183 RepID=UPI00022DC908|nr:hypothetical protein Smp_092950 [Schistosoma mansoni]|eukprot:XP_018647475.1 hypothetical protein Smp_092950 [Schistosoma mansoni]